MGGKRRIFVFAALLSVLLVVPLVFGLGIVDVPKFSFEGSSSAVESSSSASVFVDPAKNITDYEDPIHNVTIGSTVTFNVNISDVTDLFAWQINMSWDASILNVSRIIPSEFLARSDNLTSSEALGGVVINSTDNALGYGAFAETILGNVSGIPGPESGRLVSIEFLIVGYGCTNLTIGVSGTLPTMLFNSTGSSIDFDPVNGYFRNKLKGDANNDKLVDIDDILKLKYHWTGPPAGPGGYERNVDTTDDGYVDIDDILVVKANWGRGPVVP